VSALRAGGHVSSARRPLYCTLGAGQAARANAESAQRQACTVTMLVEAEEIKQPASAYEDR